MAWHQLGKKTTTPFTGSCFHAHDASQSQEKFMCCFVTREKGNLDSDCWLSRTEFSHWRKCFCLESHIIFKRCYHLMINCCCYLLWESAVLWMVFSSFIYQGSILSIYFLSDVQPTTLLSLKLEFFINTLRPRQNDRHFPDDIFKCLLLNENCDILMKISLKFVPQDPIQNIPALIQVMAWHRPGNKPLSQTMKA